MQIVGCLLNLDEVSFSCVQISYNCIWLWAGQEASSGWEIVCVWHACVRACMCAFMWQ